METMQDRLAAAVMAGLVLFGAGCSASTALSGGGHTSSAAVSSALPSPFTISARYSAASLGLNHPASLAIGPDGNLYVTDLSQRVTVISPAGMVLRRWGKPGSGPGEFRFIPAAPTIPTDVQGSIAVGPDGQVYVSDSGNARVQVFTPQGRFVRQFGSFGTGKGQFLRPSDLTVDHAGDVYVADDQADTLAKFSPGGKVMWHIGGASGDPDLTGHFHFMSFDPHGRLVVGNDDQNRVLYIDASGHEVDAFSPSTSGSPTGNECGVTADAVGDTYVTGCNSPPAPTGPTLVYNRAHRPIAKWPGTPYSLDRPPVFGPHGEVFALATDGSILQLHITLAGA